MKWQICFLLSLSLFGFGAWSHRAPALNLTFEDFKEVAEKARVATAELLEPVLKIHCKIDVDFENEKIEIQPPVKGEHIDARLCLVHQGSDPDKPVLVSLYDRLAYLYSKEPWFGFLNKAYFAAQTDRTYYIWIGELPEETRPTFQSRRDTVPVSWFLCKEKHYSEFHAYKILAVFAVFMLPNPPQKLLYLDSDVFIPFGSSYQPFSHIEKNFEDPAVFVIGNYRIQNKRKRTLLNTAHLGIRNTDLVKGILGLWWQCNCGWRDQHALALTMVAYFTSLSPQITFSTEKLHLAHSSGAFRAYFFLKSYEQEIREGPECIESQRKPTNPELGFMNSFQKPKNVQLLNDNPLCGFVSTITSQNNYCHIHVEGDTTSHPLKNESVTVSLCTREKMWPPPYPGAPLGKGTRVEYQSTWYLP